MQEASEQVAFENFSELEGQPIDLGYGITGYQDAGAGESGEKLAREATEFLETHTLPIPKPNGLLTLTCINQIIELLGKRKMYFI